MTTTSIENETDLFVVLDFEFSPPCEALKECDNAAEWVTRKSCCGDVQLLCDACWTAVKAWMKNAVNVRHEPMSRGGCGGVVDNITAEKV